MNNTCGLDNHEWITTTTFTQEGNEQFASVAGYCKVCGITFEELEALKNKQTPQNPEYRFKHLSEEPIG